MVVDSLFREYDYSLCEQAVMRLLGRGPMPKHIAFIMDGNRRWARMYGKQTSFGHSKGYDSLSYVYNLCEKMNVSQVTVYAFSIENFKRSAEEVDFLMGMLEDIFERISLELDECKQRQLRVRVFGKIQMLPETLQKRIAPVVLQTAEHSRFTLNICLAYTGREEIVNSIANLNECQARGLIEPSHITSATMSRLMYSRGAPNPDILLRTSGEIRLSDFLLYQSAFSHVEFVSEMWPEIKRRTIFGAIMRYQAEYDRIQTAHRQWQEQLVREEWKHFKELFGCQSKATFDQFCSERDQQVERCREYMEAKEMNRHTSFL